jgi:hypothetical protein
MKKSIHQIALCAFTMLIALCGCEFIAGLNENERLGSSSSNTCSDGKKGGNETDIDCGGSCSPCPNGDGCKVDGDCESKLCSSGICRAPTCMDQTKNGSESDVDCGGSCAGCAVGKTCQVNLDCDSGVCDAGKCTDYLVWAERLGSVSDTDVAQLAGLGVDASGNAAIAANFRGKVSFGGSVYDTGGANTAGFAFGRYDPLGKRIWDAGYVSTSPSEAHDVSLLSVISSGKYNGNFVTLGTYGPAALDLGDGSVLPSVSPAQLHPFIAWFSGSGAAGPAHAYGGQSSIPGSAFNGIAATLTGTTLVVGSGNYGTYNIHNTTVHDGDLFVVSIGGDFLGALWGHTYNDGGGGQDSFAGVATDADSNVILAGQHVGTLDFGGGPMNAASDGKGFVVKLDANGAHTWHRSFAATPDSLTIDNQGNVILCGKFSESVNFGSSVLTSTGTSIFVAKFDSSGKPMWSRAFPISGSITYVATLIATDSAGNILLGATMASGAVDFGHGAIEGGVLVAKLTPSGSYVWSKGIGVGSKAELLGIAAYDDAQILIGGSFQGTLKLGETKLSSVGTKDVVLAKLRLP